MAMGLFWFPGAMADLNDGLVAYYPFKGNANDESGNGLNGTVNGATLTKDRFGNPNNAYYFDGKGFINLGHSSLFDVNYHTITAWVKGEDLHLNRPNVIIGKVIPGVHEAIMLSLKKNRLSTNFATGTEINHELVGSFEFKSDRWYFVALTYDGQAATLYVDGNVDSRFPRTGTVRINTKNLAIGRHSGEDALSQSGHEFFFHGSIDEVRIYKRALIKSEIQQLSQKKNQQEEPPKECWAVYENGSLHIPCIKVIGPFGDELHYEAYLQYEALSEPMTFQVTGAKPK